MLPAAYFVVALVLWDMALVVLLHVGVVGLFGVGVELMYRTFLFDWTVAKLLPGRLEVRARDRIRPRVSDVPVPESFGAAGLGAYARVWGRGVLSRQLWASMLPLLVFLVFVTGPLVALQILL